VEVDPLIFLDLGLLVELAVVELRTLEITHLLLRHTEVLDRLIQAVAVELAAAAAMPVKTEDLGL
jgi:hypothetical protein